MSLEREAPVMLWVHPLRENYASPSLLLHALDDEERKKGRQYRREKDLIRFLMTRMVLRAALGSLGERSPKEFRFRLKETGEWELLPSSRHANLKFSIAHSEAAIAVAVSRGTPVGVDIEPIETHREKEGLELVFSPWEMAYLHGVPSDQRWKDTLRLWTTKEAYSKLLGLGSELDYASVEVGLEPICFRQFGTGLSARSHLRAESFELNVSGARHQVSLVVSPEAGHGAHFGIRSIGLSELKQYFN